MAKIGNTIATLFVGAVVGVAVGYVLATDKEKRQEDMDKIKKSLNNLKGKFAKNGEELEGEIYHS